MVISIDHLFVSCSTTKIVTSHMANWVNWWPNNVSTISETWSWVSNTTMDNLRLRVRKVITAAFCWTIWLQRNSKMFKGTCKKEKEIFSEIQFVAFDWIRCRTKFGSLLVWDKWVCNPVEAVFSCKDKRIVLQNPSWYKVFLVAPCNNGKVIEFIFSTATDGKIKAWLYDTIGSRVDYDAPGHLSTTMACSAGGTRNCFLAAGDEFTVKFWDMDNVNLLTTTDADADFWFLIYLQIPMMSMFGAANTSMGQSIMDRVAPIPSIVVMNCDNRSQIDVNPESEMSLWKNLECGN
ncbi:hypothetical protein OSB04_008620 [Centaurea solstitialis]|uniref:Uncharacterized protein n=1 Tax=Centaurea solstitialis TaxID=347529 RepID=A0AA38TM56_9ASTR|nr:hypothetical protein OSB04_008620 [Centaurea solstitialis]